MCESAIRNIYWLGEGNVGGLITTSTSSARENLGTWGLYEFDTCLGTDSQGWSPVYTAGRISGCKKTIYVAPRPADCSPCSAHGAGNAGALGGAGDGSVGDPIEPGSAAQREYEVDYASRGAGSLKYDRFWDSNQQQWSAGFTQRLLVDGSAQPEDYCEWLFNTSTNAYRRVCGKLPSAGAVIAAARQGRISWQFASVAPFAPISAADKQVSLVSSGTEWLLRLPTGAIERYDAQGVLLSITAATGQSQIVTYVRGGSVYPSGAPACSGPAGLAPADRPRCVTDWRGSQLVFGYEGTGPTAALTSVTVPDGSTYSYIYNGASAILPAGFGSARLLTSVSYPGATQRTYYYNESAFAPAIGSKMFLTGMSDELGVRSATFKYDSKGRPKSTESAGLDRHEIDYSAIDATGETFAGATPLNIGIKFPNDTTITRTYQVIGGYARITQVSAPAAGATPASAQALVYDSNGNVTSRTNFNGSRNCYASDTNRNLETTRVEGLSNTVNCGDVTLAGAALPLGSRKTSTQWHPDSRFAVKVSEPGRLTTNIYNGQPDPFNGNALASCAPSTALLPDGKPIAVLCKQVEQATSDANGSQGFSASLQSGVTNRVQQWTYNQSGQMLTAKDPLNNTMTYTYYSDTTADHTLGDLQTVTNAKNQVTTYTKYNKHGQLLESTDPNGMLSVNTYDLRQRLLSTSTGGQTTSYEYDPAGQLLKVTSPDQSWIGYEYDAAHRQTAVKDNLGNRIEYVLDNAGNKTGQSVKDPLGNLARSLARSIDALGRVQQATGRQ